MQKYKPDHIKGMMSHIHVYANIIYFLPLLPLIEMKQAALVIFLLIVSIHHTPLSIINNVN